MLHSCLLNERIGAGTPAWQTEAGELLSSPSWQNSRTQVAWALSIHSRNHDSGSHGAALYCWGVLGRMKKQGWELQAPSGMEGDSIRLDGQKIWFKIVFLKPGYLFSLSLTCAFISCGCPPVNSLHPLVLGIRFPDHSYLSFLNLILSFDGTHLLIASSLSQLL